MKYSVTGIAETAKDFSNIVELIKNNKWDNFPFIVQQVDKDGEGFPICRKENNDFEFSLVFFKYKPL